MYCLLLTALHLAFRSPYYLPEKSALSSPIAFITLPTLIEKEILALAVAVSFGNLVALISMVRTVLSQIRPGTRSWQR